MTDLAIFTVGLILGVVAGPFLIGAVIVGMFAVTTVTHKIGGGT